jgi:hypothetical protein
LSDDTLPDGYAVKKGDMVNYQPYAMGRMDFLWGADAEEFRPERWLDKDGVFVPESPFKFTAFQVSSNATPFLNSVVTSLSSDSIARSIYRQDLASAWEKNSRTGR